jgi:hypothetical protein
VRAPASVSAERFSEARVQAIERTIKKFIRAIAQGVDASSLRGALGQAELELADARRKRDELALALRS